MGYIDSFNDLLLFSYDLFLNIFWLMFYADLVVRVSSGFPICGPMHVSCIFFFYIFYTSIVTIREGGFEPWMSLLETLRGAR